MYVYYNYNCIVKTLLNYTFSNQCAARARRR